jgi:hypothetical protein
MEAFDRIRKRISDYILDAIAHRIDTCGSCGTLCITDNRWEVLVYPRTGSKGVVQTLFKGSEITSSNLWVGIVRALSTRSYEIRTLITSLGISGG